MSEFRLHGANPNKLYKSFAIEMPRQVVDFSTNTNVLPWTGQLGLDLPRLLGDYPDDDCSELRALLAERNGCSPEEILVTNGSNEAIYLLASCYAPTGTNCILQPAYGEYARALRAFGAEPRALHALDGLDSAAVLWLCNPCNPTGTWISATVMAAELERRRSTQFIVDEAYIDFLTEERELLSFDSHRNNLVLLRSLTKSFHLCGVRAGYVVANSDTISALKRRQPTWSVNGVAQAAALIFLSDDEYLEKTREFYRRETPRFIEMIQSAGFNVMPTCVNFFLVEAKDDRSLIGFLLRRGLVVRHTRNFDGLDGRFVRVATRLPDENELLAQALIEFKR